ncbi:FtsL-like putative cell division protein [Portibacter lacus]|uniref:Cell division protein FtsL n=1 Tax=Portibacter lacus TaxID=1099794 RepID=A0AA37SJ94_9BACT|nr:FtsL-like putative cell division protein [Portibacter lacus]GLR15773.1 hypothetical protein GCM10007940_03880 [Portibacter lacus]
MTKKKPVSGQAKKMKLGFGLASLMKNVTFVFLIAFLGVVYIFNSHYAESNLRKTKKLENQIREAKWEYMSLKSDIMQKSTRSEIGKKLDGYKDLENQNLPRKIEASKS